MHGKLNIDIIFWIGYTLIILTEMFNNVPVVDRLSTIINLTGLFFLILFILMKNKKYSLNFLISMFFLFLISLVVFSKINDFTILKLLLLLISLKNIGFDSYIKKEFTIRLTLFVCVFLCSIFGFCETIFFVRGNIIRYTLGFIHPNTAGFYLYLLGCEYIYLKKDNKKSTTIFSLVICFLIQFVTNSRTSLLAMIIVLLGYIYSEYVKTPIWEDDVIRVIVKNSFLWVTVLTVVLIKLYSSKNDIATFINNSFSNRLDYFQFFWDSYSVKLFGNNLTTFYVLDSTYLQLLLRFGLLIYIVYYYLYMKRIDLAIREKNYVLLVIMIAMIFYGFTENAGFKSTYNIFLLSFSDYLFKKNKESKSNVQFENIYHNSYL